MWKDHVLTEYVGSTLVDAKRSPADISAVNPFDRSRVYFLFDSLHESETITTVKIQITANHDLQSLVIPVSALEKRDTTLHKLAARSMLDDLERGRSHIHLGLNRPVPGSWEEINMVRNEAEEIACKWSLVSKWTSFFLAEEPYSPTGDDAAIEGVIEVKDTPRDDLLQPRGTIQEGRVAWALGNKTANGLETQVADSVPTRGPSTQISHRQLIGSMVTRQNKSSKRSSVGHYYRGADAMVGRRRASIFGSLSVGDNSPQQYRTQQYTSGAQLYSVGAQPYPAQPYSAQRYSPRAFPAHPPHFSSPAPNNPSRPALAIATPQGSSFSHVPAAATAPVVAYGNFAPSYCGRHSEEFSFVSDLSIIPSLKRRTKISSRRGKATFGGAQESSWKDQVEFKISGPSLEGTERTRTMSAGNKDRGGKEESKVLSWMTGRAKTSARKTKTTKQRHETVAPLSFQDEIPILDKFTEDAYMPGRKVQGSARGSRPPLSFAAGGGSDPTDDCLPPVGPDPSMDTLRLKRSYNPGLVTQRYREAWIRDSVDIEEGPRRMGEELVGLQAPGVSTSPAAAAGKEERDQQGKQAERAFITTVLSFQCHDGSIDFVDWLAAQRVLGADIADALSLNIQAAFPDVSQEILWTLAVWVVLERDFQSCKALWELMGLKMKAFCEKNLGSSACHSRLLGEVQAALKDLRVPIHQSRDKQVGNEVGKDEGRPDEEQEDEQHCSEQKQDESRTGSQSPDVVALETTAPKPGPDKDPKKPQKRGKSRKKSRSPNDSKKRDERKKGPEKEESPNLIPSWMTPWKRNRKAKVVTEPTERSKRASVAVVEECDEGEDGNYYTKPLEPATVSERSRRRRTFQF